MLSFQTFTSLVQLMAAAAQGACSSLLNFTQGSVIRAIMQANASVAMWMQWLLLLLMNRQRLATSSGADVDSFVNDFALYRLPAIPATGTVTFSRYTTSASATIAVGTTVKTGDGLTSFAVTQDTTNTYWSTSALAYVIPAGTASITVPIQAQVAGTGGNVTAGSISLLGVALPGVNTVTNATALTNGVAAETDAALKARFPNYIGSLASATVLAVDSAIAGVQQGLTYSVAENVSTSGAYEPGNFVVTIDDGSGYPSTNLQAAVYAAVNAVRPIGSTFAVQPPTVLSAAIVLTITNNSSVTHASVQGLVNTAIAAFVNALPIGSVLPYSRIAQVAYATSPAIANVTGVTVNGGTADIGGGPSQVVKTSSITVN